MDLATAATLAGVLEATAAKPGNVHPRCERKSLRYTQLLAAAAAVGPAVADTADRPLGAAILECVRRSRAVVATNANLGIVLVLAALAEPERLGRTTVQDTRDLYEAIRLAEPGGLGRVPEQDVADEPTVDLLAAMELAADRDAIAAQYVDRFAGLRRVAADRFAGGGPLEPAIVACQLHWLAAGDTLIGRKHGPAAKARAAALARAVLENGRQEPLPAAAEVPDASSLDRWLRRTGCNPGSSADLTAGCLFVALRDGLIDVDRAWFAASSEGASA